MAWQAICLQATTLAGGGLVFGHDKVHIACCNDGVRPVIFKFAKLPRWKGFITERENMVIVQKSDNTYSVFYHGKAMGTVVLYHNLYHRTNCYVKLELNCLDPKWSTELFCKLKEISGCPLQAMAASNDTQLTAFLTAGGFVCKRKCYEMEVGIADYIGEIKNAPLFHAVAGEAEYEQACRQIYTYYVASHEKINPWTADFAAFCGKLPRTVLYAKNGTEITSFAFIEDNEIAYVYGKGDEQFKEFAQCLVTSMLTQYETICFESDDCDWVAMELRGLFQNRDEPSYDTYVYDGEA